MDLKNLKIGEKLVVKASPESAVHEAQSCLVVLNKALKGETEISKKDIEELISLIKDLSRYTARFGAGH